ncbi:hypothetical protein CMO88_01120 [Candidatus Woesearchaeota archaeon]|nr:hypothetical protein [Candidatus Woesearchaeota archaeon]|tara:strand:- start:4617 stop:5729 length:1113 start_codon:yes stop_codon:yes gene_type:complete
MVKNILKNLLLLMITVSILLVFTEVLFHFFLFPYYATYIPDENLVYRMGENLDMPHEGARIGHVVTNDAGFVYQNPQIERSTDKRIFILGDSFAMGLYIEPEKRFSRLVEKKLNNEFEESYEVLSYGAGSWGTANQFKYLENALKYNPDQLIMPYYNNDLENVASTFLLAFKDDKVIDLTPVKIPFIKKTLLNCARFLNTCHWTVRFYAAHNDKLGRFVRLIGVGAKPKISQKSVNFGVDPYTKESNEAVELAWRNTALILRDMKETLDEKNVSFSIVYVPAKLEIQKTDFDLFLQQNNLKAENVSITSYAEKLGEIAEELGINFFDPSQALIEGAKDGDVYYPDDFHFNENGETVFSEFVYDAVVFSKP